MGGFASGSAGMHLGAVPGGPKALGVDRDRLSPERTLAEVDVGLPAIGERRELAIMGHRPRRTIVAFGEHARIGRRIEASQVLEPERPAEAKLEEHDQDAGSRRAIDQAV